MQAELPTLAASLSVFSEVLGGIDHRIYYTCVQDQSNWTCAKGQWVPSDSSKAKPYKKEHICAFQVSGQTSAECNANADKAFLKKFPGHTVVPTIDFYSSPPTADTTRSGQA